MLHNPAAPTATSLDDPIAVMQRFELKYIMTPAQEAQLKRAMEGHMTPDQFGLTSIASLYYDTPDARLIRASLEKPKFKEKLRLRSYGLATEFSPVYLELKRKVEGVVYKRRVQTTARQAVEFLAGKSSLGLACQIGRELTAFRDYYETLVPACMIIYDRTAYIEADGDLRLTIDGNPRYRSEHLGMTHSMEGTSLLPPGCSILELKVQSAVPLWLTKALSEAKLYQTSFSKYGEAYRRELQAHSMRSAS
ncbi:MAG: polyphosphate polymerase domain-containing protein [Oscillospiraceae bacterium]|nr:polyphosphate polymerase domain-containing protein [Oscillospiraceae bacterium]